jgi:hypothetical protein
VDSLFLALVRTEAVDDRTLGVLLANGSHFCHVLEDQLRAEGVKVKGRTAIPAGLYRVRLTWSPRFGRITPQILDVPQFEGVRMHGGNDPDDTEGCPLVAFNRVGLKIQGTAEAALTKRIQDAGGSCLLAIVDHLKPVPA